MLRSEQETKPLYEAFLDENVNIRKQIREQNKVITIILGCLIVGAVILLCILIL
jgi:hypothetical protein